MRVGRGSCQLWDVMNDRFFGWGGGHPRACRDSHPDPCNDQESGRKREKGREMNRESWPNVEEGKRDERERVDLF